MKELSLTTINKNCLGDGVLYNGLVDIQQVSLQDNPDDEASQVLI